MDHRPGEADGAVTEHRAARRGPRDQGLHVFDESLRCEVEGTKGPLMPDVLEKAKAFADRVIAAVK